MSTTIHPYKGYLNTNYNVHVKDIRQNYLVYKKGCIDETPILSGIVNPNEPHFFNMAQPGDFTVLFENGEKVDIHVKDGYKFGGSTLKKSFIFDDCPWCFVVMHDRTYFYNRETGESYIESISPDEISEISEDYVMLKNFNQKECSIYSLVDQKPILIISDIIYYNYESIIWREIEDDKTNLFIFSLIEKRQLICHEVSAFSIDEKGKRLILSINNIVKTINLTGDFTTKTLLNNVRLFGNIASVIAPNLAVEYCEKVDGNSLYLYDIDSDKLLKRIDIDGGLAGIGNNIFIDIYDRKESIKSFNLKDTAFPEAITSANYYEFNFFPIDKDVFYSQKCTSLVKSTPNRVDSTTECVLKSCNSELCQKLNLPFDKYVLISSLICFYNPKELLIWRLEDATSEYIIGDKIYIDNNNIFRHSDSKIYKLGDEGVWHLCQEGRLDFSFFQQFKVVEEKETQLLRTIGGQRLGKRIVIWNGSWNNELPRIQSEKYYVFENGMFLEIQELPKCFSDSLQFAIDVNKEGVFLWTKECQAFSKDQILEGLYDSTEYKDVLLSEDGTHIMHRDGKQAIVMNVAKGSSQIYDNLSFIQHINGIRPLFTNPCSLQPRLVNPITGQIIDCTALTQFQFISPSGELFAETELNEYIEYYDLIKESVITKQDFSDICDQYCYKFNFKDSAKYKDVINARKSFVTENFSYLKNKALAQRCANRTDDEWFDFFVDERKILSDDYFISYFIEKRGIAVIKSTTTKEIVAKIQLGKPLWFLNYVSFSHDNRFVALAGRYPNGTNYGGLLLVYDFQNQENVLFQTSSWAVWNTAFSQEGLVAAYSGEPISYIGQSSSDMTIDKISGKSFLTFSQNGKYIAFSNQGYISKYDKNGDERSVWGHQDSTDVFLAKSNSPTEILIAFSDLADVGLEGNSDRRQTCSKCIASVSFSNDNRRILMVGKDGVVIIRNLNLEDYAC